MSKYPRYLALLLEAPPGHAGRNLEYAVALDGDGFTVEAVRDACTLELLGEDDPLPSPECLRAAVDLEHWCRRHRHLFLR